MNWSQSLSRYSSLADQRPRSFWLVIVHDSGVFPIIFIVLWFKTIVLTKFGPHVPAKLSPST
jgi:hypothetical protein